MEVKQQRADSVCQRLSLAMHVTTFEQLRPVVLTALLEELGGQLGCFGHVNQDRDMSCLTMRLAQSGGHEVDTAKLTVHRTAWRGPWGLALTTRRPLVAETEFRAPMWTRPLTNALAVPMLLGDELIGQLMVADKAGGYSSQDRHLMERVAAQAAPVVAARLAEDRARRHIQRLEAELGKAKKMEAVGKLAGGIAHDFNNLLTVITNYARMSAEELPHDDPMHDDMLQILAAGNRAASLTNQLLAFSRRQVMLPRVLDLSEVIAGMRGRVQELLGEDIQLRTWLRPGQDWINADPDQLQQVVIYLVTNAREAMPHGGMLTLETREQQVSPDGKSGDKEIPAGRYVVLSVTDTGVGISPEVMRRIFEPFFTTKEVGEGPGLGLATVQGIVSQSGGQVRAESTPGRGATFLVYLPSVAGSSA